MGSTTIVYTEVVVRLMAIEMDKATEVAPGETIGVDVPWDRIHIFDPENGRSLRN